MLRPPDAAVLIKVRRPLAVPPLVALGVVVDRVDMVDVVLLGLELDRE